MSVSRKIHPIHYQHRPVIGLLYALPLGICRAAPGDRPAGSRVGGMRPLVERIRDDESGMRCIAPANG